ncbi:IS3 family transposase [Caldifermentibacillus hisashii]|uniref:IS3 family transposase n=1 Tax=Caldifermentibacillus hisashii TaxID=996558 RepID=UPI0031FDC883
MHFSALFYCKIHASKIHHLLSEEGYYVSLKRVQRLMKKAGVKSITVKSFDQRQVRKRS